MLNIDPTVVSKDEIIQWRHHLHQHPELSFQEYETASFVETTLKSFGNIVTSRPTPTSVIGILNGAEPGKTIALRADMDALPINEETGLPYASEAAGIMHACGHDVHTSVLLGVAKCLSQHQHLLKGQIRFVFQHAEELPPGGAAEIVATNALDGVDYMFGQHIVVFHPTGKVGTAYGALTSADDAFTLRIIGKGGHGAMPETTVDPIVVSAEVILALQTIVARNIAPLDSGVVTIGQIVGGTTDNVIPGYVEIKGDIRSFNEETRVFLRQRIEEIVKGITIAHRAEYELHFNIGYASIQNDTNATNYVINAANKVVGADHVVTDDVVMVSEDFAAYSLAVPSNFTWVGCGNEEKGTHYPHHHEKFVVDEDSFEIAYKLFLQTVQDCMNDQ